MNLRPNPRPNPLPLFPLGIVLFPDETVPLHIFEERYKRLVEDCLRDEMPFGIVLYEGGKLSQVGCAATIASIERTYEDGRLDINVVGNERFRVNRITDDGSYMLSDVDWFDDDRRSADGREVQRLIAQHMKLLELAGRTVRPEFYEGEGLLSFRLGRNAGLELAQKQDLLEAQSEPDRVALLVGHLEQFIPKVEQFEVVRQKVRSNGHFTDFPPENLQGRDDA